MYPLQCSSESSNHVLLLPLDFSGDDELNHHRKTTIALSLSLITVATTIMHAAAIYSPNLRPSSLDPLHKHSPIPALLTKPRKLLIAVASSLTTLAPKCEKDPKKRVVITGTGLVSVFRNYVDTYYDRLLVGKSGVGLIDRFDASKFPTRFAGQIHGFSYEGYIDGKNALKNQTHP